MAFATTTNDLLADESCYVRIADGSQPGYLSLMDRMGVKLDRFGDSKTRLAGF